MCLPCGPGDLSLPLGAQIVHGPRAQPHLNLALSMLEIDKENFIYVQ